MPKDFWDRIQAMGGLLTPLSVALVGILGSNYLTTKQAEDTKARFYADLVSKREEADSSLRKDMFNTVITTFLNPKSSDPSRKILSLELLASNFHESLDLGPIFKSVYAETAKLPKSVRKDLLDRLSRVASETKDKQILSLAGSGGIRIDGYLSDLPRLRKDAIPVTMIDQVVDLPAAGEVTGAKTVKTHVVVWANVVKDEEIRVRLEVTTEDATYADNVFWVGPFDLPILDNTRLTNGQRCAIVLTKFDAATSAEITLVIFPSSRASLKDKPYVDEVLSQLMSKQAGK